MEDPLTLARRHVLEGEARVRRQEALVAELARDGHPIEDAQALLATMRRTLVLMRDDLAQAERRSR